MQPLASHIYIQNKNASLVETVATVPTGTLNEEQIPLKQPAFTSVTTNVYTVDPEQSGKLCDIIPFDRLDKFLKIKKAYISSTITFLVLNFLTAVNIPFLIFTVLCYGFSIYFVTKGSCFVCGVVLGCIGAVIQIVGVVLLAFVGILSGSSLLTNVVFVLLALLCLLMMLLLYLGIRLLVFPRLFREYAYHYEKIDRL